MRQLLTNHGPQFARYVGVGLTAFTCEYGTYLLLYWHGVPLLTAHTTAYVIGFTITFLGQRHITFRAKGNAHKHFMRFCINEAFGYALQTGVLLVLVDMVQVSAEISKVLAMGAVVGLNFLMYKFFVYR